MENEGVLHYFEPYMVAGDRRGGLSILETADLLLLFHTTISRVV